jgi:cytoskeletal protein CcmA (bactofilin family)
MAKNEDHKGSERIATTLGRETEFSGTMRFRDSLKIDVEESRGDDLSREATVDLPGLPEDRR